MFRNFLMRKMLKSQLKGMPEEEQEKVLALVSKNPEFFQKLALEIQEKIKEGKDQMTASQEAVLAHKTEIEHIIKG